MPAWSTLLDMTKRIVAALLWFYAGWWAGNDLAALFGVSPLLGPLIGLCAGVLIVVDPRRIIWSARTTDATTVTTATTVTESLPEPS